MSFQPASPNVTILYSHGGFAKTRKSTLNTVLLPEVADCEDFASCPTNVLFFFFLLFGFLKNIYIYTYIHICIYTYVYNFYKM